MEEVAEKIDKRTRSYRNRKAKRDFSHLKCGKMVDGKWENDFSLCMHCGDALPPNDDGSPKFRRQPEACYDCVHAEEGFMIRGGKRVPIPGK